MNVTVNRKTSENQRSYATSVHLLYLLTNNNYIFLVTLSLSSHASEYAICTQKTGQQTEASVEWTVPFEKMQEDAEAEELGGI
jgi:hypothetical protein